MKTSECVGCGYCCMKTPCDASRRLYPGGTTCPQLFWSEEKSRYLCGLMVIPGLVGEGYRKEIYAGAGCCSSLNSWRKDVKERTTQEARHTFHQLDSVFQAFLKCWASDFTSGDKIILTLAQLRVELIKNQNFSENDADITIRSITHCIDQNRHSFMKGFMG